MSMIINQSQIKIIEEIFRNPGINLRGIISSTKLSPNYVSSYVNNLVEKSILKEEKLTKKRTYLRRFSLDFSSNMTNNIFLLVKEEEKGIFFENYPKLKPLFNQIKEEIIGIDFIIVYGSYSRLSAKKDSDIDILIVGNVRNKEHLREILVSLEIETSIKIETLDYFKKMKKDALHTQILYEGVLIYDSGKFIEVIKE